MFTSTFIITFSDLESLVINLNMSVDVSMNDAGEDDVGFSHVGVGGVNVNDAGEDDVGVSHVGVDGVTMNDVVNMMLLSVMLV